MDSQVHSPARETGRLTRLCAAAFAIALWQPIAVAQNRATPVEVDSVSTVSVEETVSIFGRIVALQSGTVTASVSAPVAQVHVNAGDRVAQGDLLVTLDSSSLDIERSQMVARSDIGEWKIKRAETELGLKSQQERRLAALRGSSAATEAQHEDAVVMRDAARAELGEQKSSRQLILRQLDLVDHRLSLMQIRAPYAGVVAEKLIESGEFASAGKPVARMIADQDLEIEVYVPYRFINSLNKGDVVSASFDNGTTFDATVRAIIPEEHASTRTRAVRFAFELDDPDEVLAVNQNVTINVPATAERASLSVHKDAILARGDAYVAFVVSDGEAAQRMVSIGDAVGNRFEVVSGLQEGELVVVRGNERLRNGQKVLMIN